MTEEKRPSQHETVIDDLVDIWSGIIQLLDERRDEIKAGKVLVDPRYTGRYDKLVQSRMKKYDADRPSPFHVDDKYLRNLYERANAIRWNMSNYSSDILEFMRGNAISLDQRRKLSKEYLDDLKDKIQKELDALLLEANPISKPPEAPPVPPLNITAGTTVLSIPPLQ